MKIALFVTILSGSLLSGSFLFALTQNSPNHPVDPTAKAPSILPAPTQPTLEEDAKPADAGLANSRATATASSNEGKKATYVGRIIRKRHEYVLKAADAEYLLDDHGEAKKYKGKLVKVTGRADDNHVIRVKTIKLSSPE